MAASGNPEPFARIPRGRDAELRLIHDSHSGSPTVLFQAVKAGEVRGRFSLWLSEIPAVLEALEGAWTETVRRAR